MAVELSAPAKVNLHLEIGEKRADGYHALRSLCVKVNLFDRLFVELMNEGYELNSPDDLFFSQDVDLLYKAVNFYKKLSGKEFGIKIKLIKNIPMQAGLGGGSSDAGVLLRFLNQHFDEAVPWYVLIRESAAVGADVPLFVHPCTAAWMEGIGEKIVPLAPRPLDILLCFPHMGINTKEAYAALDVYGQGHLYGFEEDDTKQMWAKHPKEWKFFNSFSQKLTKEYPFIEKGKEFLRQFPVDYVELSGSGSTIAAVADKHCLQNLSVCPLGDEFSTCSMVSTLLE